MFFIFLTALVSLILVSPIVFWCFDKTQANRWKLLALFIGYFLIADIILYIPFFSEALQFGIKPWAVGKVLNIIFSIAFYLLFKKYFKDYTFLRLKQDNKIIKYVGVFCFVVLLLSLLVFTVDILFFNNWWKPETTDFQDVFFTMTLPGIEEEIVYRGIMLGLLATLLTSKKFFGGKLIFHPGIWITGFFFGLAHGFRILPDWTIYWDWVDVSTSTVLSGAFFAWLTLKSKSIVTPILIHNAIFFIVALVDNMHP